VTHLISRDRAKTTAWMGKRKENLSSQSGSFSTMNDIMSTPKKLGTSFTRTQIYKQYNKLRTANIADMDAKELTTHHEALRLIIKDLNF
jgi:hypothetical protein